MARYLLAAIRIVNGAIGLFAPQLLIRRFGDADPDHNPAAIYGLRLFGVRTVLIGLDLLTLRGEELERAVRRGVLIHVSDTATAAALGLSRQLPPETAVPVTLISATNTALALAALTAERRKNA